MQIKSGYQLSLNVQRTPTTCEPAKSLVGVAKYIFILLAYIRIDFEGFLLLLNGFASQKKKCGPIVVDDNLDKMTSQCDKRDFTLDSILL